MPTTPVQDTRPAANTTAPVDRYLLVCLYLMVITGFGTLAATGQLDLPSVVFVTAALLWRGYVLLIRKTVVLPESWNTRLALGFVLFYVVDVAALSRSFLTATVHLVMCGLVVKMFSPLRDRDYVLLSALSFAMVLAASVLTVDSAFFLAFCIFLLMAVGTFILLQMRRASAQATVLESGQDPERIERQLGFSLSTVTPAILILILAGAAGIFFVLPRVSAGYAGSYSTANDFSTGFSDEVRLGGIGAIQQSQAVVMHVEVQGGTLPEELKWRGVALSFFDGFTWSNTHGSTVARRGADGRFLVARESTGRPGNHLHYRVVLEPLNNNVFFMAEQPWALAGNYSLVGLDADGAVFNLDHEHPIGLYEGESTVERASPAELRQSASAVPARIPQAYLQLPDVDPRVVQLAHDVTANADNDYDKAVALESHLRLHYGYTLQLPAKTPQDPLANFLFERKQGHCEYFASSMAVMLRSIGIPSRVVNGFRGGEFNDLSGKYVIRASDAHSWVEAFFPGYGWVSFDPTPAGSLVQHKGNWNRIAQYLDAMTSFWREWIVNYDFARQRSLGEEGARQSRALLENLRKKATAQYQSLLRLARTAHSRSGAVTMAWLQGGAAIGCLLLLLSNTARLRRWSQGLIRKRDPASATRDAAALWYERMTQALSKRGWSKAPEQTAVEFLEKIPEARVRESVENFTRHYERARFAGSAQDAERLPRLYKEVTTASK